jgi:hypothetical protein
VSYLIPRRRIGPDPQPTDLWGPVSKPEAMNRGQSASPRTKADCADELVDLAIALSVDSPAYLALHTAFDSA